MKKISVLFCLVFVSLFLCVSCSGEVKNDGLVTVDFTGEVADTSRNIGLVEESVYKPEDLFWMFTAEKKSGIHNVGATPLNEDGTLKKTWLTDGGKGRGLSGYPKQFSTGEWEFKIYGYKAATESDANLIFTGTKTVTLSDSTVVTFTLTPDTTNYASGGSLMIDMLSILPNVDVALASGKTVTTTITDTTTSTAVNVATITTNLRKAYAAKTALLVLCDANVTPSSKSTGFSAGQHKFTVRVVYNDGSTAGVELLNGTFPVNFTDRCVTHISGNLTELIKRDYRCQCLCITANAASKVRMLKGTSATKWNHEFLYSSNGIDWYDYGDFTETGFNMGDSAAGFASGTAAIAGKEISLSTGEKVYFKSKEVIGTLSGHDGTGLSGGVDDTWSAKYRYKFRITGDVSLSGKLMTMIDADTDTTTVTRGPGFVFLFCGCDVTHAKDLQLTCTSSNRWCLYFDLFLYCTKLVDAPDLSALSEVGTFGYCRMFERCSALVDVPDKLPAMTLGRCAYDNMFQGCTSLETPPEICATNVDGDNVLTRMFQNATKLKSIKVHFTTFPTNSVGWVDGVTTGDATRHFICPAALCAEGTTTGARGINNIPSGWYVANF